MQSALVTGSNSGIGKYISSQLQKLGYIVYDVDIANESSVDVTNLEVIQQYLVSQNVQSLDTVITCAGIFDMTDFVDLNAEKIDNLVDINIKGTINTILACIPYLKKSKSASVVTISSGLASSIDPNSLLYSVTKSAIVSLTEGLAIRFAKEKIRFNTIMPGPIDTPLLTNELSETEIKDYVNHYNPMETLGKVEDVWHGVEYLISEKANYVTGTSLAIDGGESVASIYAR